MQVLHRGSLQAASFLKVATHRLDIYSRRSIQVPGTLRKLCKCTMPVSRRLQVPRETRISKWVRPVVQLCCLFRTKTKKVTDVMLSQAIAATESFEAVREGATKSDAMEQLKNSRGELSAASNLHLPCFRFFAESLVAGLTGCRSEPCSC